MRLNFRHIEIHSFMSFEDETFDFDSHPGMTLIRGRNADLPNDETNGSGKCLAPDTVITVEVSDEQIEKDLVNLLRA